MFMSLRSRRTFFTAWPLFVNSLMQHLSPKTLRQFCFPEVTYYKAPMGQKDKEWDGKTWVERPQVVLGPGSALFSLASLDLCPVRRVWSSNPARTPGRESEYEGRLSGRLDTEDTHKVNHCAGYTSHLHLSETGRTVSQHQLVPPILGHRASCYFWTVEVTHLQSPTPRELSIE